MYFSKKSKGDDQKYSCKLSYKREIDICLVNEDITKVNADAIVNSCNNLLVFSKDLDSLKGIANSIIIGNLFYKNQKNLNFKILN